LGVVYHLTPPTIAIVNIYQLFLISVFFFMIVVIVAVITLKSSQHFKPIFNWSHAGNTTVHLVEDAAFPWEL